MFRKAKFCYTHRLPKLVVNLTSCRLTLLQDLLHIHKLFRKSSKFGNRQYFQNCKSTVVGNERQLTFVRWEYTSKTKLIQFTYLDLRSGNLGAPRRSGVSRLAPPGLIRLLKGKNGVYEYVVINDIYKFGNMIKTKMHQYLIYK